MDIPTYLSQIAQSGVMGVFNVIFMIAIWVLWKDSSSKAKQVNDEKDKRLADAVIVRDLADKKEDATRQTLETLIAKMDGYLKK